MLRDVAHRLDSTWLTRAFILRHPAQVEHFLASSTELVPILAEARQQLQVYFGDPRPALEVVTDPEVEGESQLLLTIPTALPIEEAMERLRRFDHEWWLERLPTARGKLYIDIAFE